MSIRTLSLLRLLLLVLLVPASASAASLTCAGILGNSGEQGASLVKFGETPAHGLGVVYDKYGTLWDRGGSGVLNRYAVDGRLVASYPLPKSSAHGDSIAVNGDEIVLLIKGNLYTLPVDAAAGTTPTSLGVAADLMSLSVVQGKIALVRDGSLIVLDLASKTEQAASAAPLDQIHSVELRPDGAVVVVIDKSTHLFRDGKEVTDGWPRSSPGTPFQFLDNYWYGLTYHGTVRRFNADMEADPGVVLGGGSGGFIGHVDGNMEIEAGNGLASLGGGIFAISGMDGIMHLMHWNEARKEMEIERRIGAIPICRGLGLNKQGQVWFNCGRWEWNDSPVEPLRDNAAAVDLGQVSMLPNDMFIAMSTRNGLNVETGNFTHDAKWTDFGEKRPKQVSLIDTIGAALGDLIKNPTALLQGSVVYPGETNGSLVFLAINNRGEGLAYDLNSHGDFRQIRGAVTLHAAQPVREFTSLGMRDKDTLLAGADGSILEMTRDGDNWKETKRWNTWGEGADAKFGSRIFLSVDGDHLWVSDSTRQRVLCFSLATNNLIASFGELDKAGNDLAHLDSPQVVIGREKRAVVFDSANQRLVKLNLSE